MVGSRPQLTPIFLFGCSVTHKDSPPSPHWNHGRLHQHQLSVCLDLPRRCMLKYQSDKWICWRHKTSRTANQCQGLLVFTLALLSLFIFWPRSWHTRKLFVTDLRPDNSCLSLTVDFGNCSLEQPLFPVLTTPVQWALSLCYPLSSASNHTKKECKK